MGLSPLVFQRVVSVQPLDAVGDTEFGEGRGRQQQFDRQFGPADRKFEGDQAIGALFDDPHEALGGVAHRERVVGDRGGRGGW